MYICMSCLHVVCSFGSQTRDIEAKAKGKEGVTCFVYTCVYGRRECKMQKNFYSTGCKAQKLMWMRRKEEEEMEQDM